MFSYMDTNNSNLDPDLHVLNQFKNGIYYSPQKLITSLNDDHGELVFHYVILISRALKAIFLSCNHSKICDKLNNF